MDADDTQTGLTGGSRVCIVGGRVADARRNWKRPLRPLQMRLSRDELAADLERVGAGDVDAFIRVYHATSRKLFGIVVRILGRGELADEVLQEVYLRVWQRASDFSADRASPITWLATVARNRALDEARRRQMGSIEDMPELLEFPSDEDIAGAHAEREQLKKLHDCLGRLPPKHREILQLVYFEGLTRDQIAERTGETLATVKAWLRKSLAQLKGCIEP